MVPANGATTPLRNATAPAENGIVSEGQEMALRRERNFQRGNKACAGWPLSSQPAISPKCHVDSAAPDGIVSSFTNHVTRIVY